MPVPDDTFYRFIGGRGGRISYDLTKQHGGNTNALRCVLPSGRTLDWYHTSVLGAAACNNVGEPIVQTVLQRLQAVRSQSTIIPQAPQVLWFESPHIPRSTCCPNCGHNHVYELPDTYISIPTNPIVSGPGSAIQMN